VRDFGAKGDGVADDADAVQNAIAEGLKLVGGRKPDVAYDMKKYAGYGPVVVYLPRGTYLVNKPLKVPCGSYSWNRALRITGESARIKAGKPMDAVLHVNIASHITVEGLTLDGAGLAQNGFTALKISGRNGLVDRVSVNGAVSHGFALEKCQGGVFRACSSGGNGGDGWRIVDCNAAVFDGCAATHNKGNGFTVAAKDFSGGCVVSGPWSEANLGDGVSVESAVSAQVVLRDGWLEANGRDGIRIASVSAHVTGMNIAGDFRDDSREGTPRQRSDGRLDPADRDRGGLLHRREPDTGRGAQGRTDTRGGEARPAPRGRQFQALRRPDRRPRRRRRRWGVTRPIRPRGGGGAEGT